MTYQFQIQGSSIVPYVVEFSFSENQFSARCNCPAGYTKTLCKHIISILEGEIPKGLIDGETNNIPEIVRAFNESEVSDVYNHYLTTSDEIELLKKEMKNRKRQVARMLYQ